MLKTLQDTYFSAHLANSLLYKERIQTLFKNSGADLIRYISNELPLFAHGNENTILYITMADIEKAITTACVKGINFVEYRVHKHYYPGYKGDNISFLTGKYYIIDLATKKYIEIPGAPSYIEALGERLPGLTITFRECEHDNGFLRIELPITKNLELL